MKKIILDLCGGTGSWAKPYKDSGYDVRTLTLPDFDVEKWRDNKEFVELRPRQNTANEVQLLSRHHKSGWRS